MRILVPLAIGALFGCHQGHGPTQAPSPAGTAPGSTVPDSAGLVITTDCNLKGCAKAAVSVVLNNSGYSQTIEAGGSSTFAGLPGGEAVVTVRSDADHRRPLLGEAKVALRPGASSNATIVMAVVEATSSIAGMLIEQDGRRAAARPGSQLVVDIECRGFQRRTIAAADGSFTALDLIPGECTLCGLRIDPRDPMSGGNGLRRVSKVVAPATGVKVGVSDFSRR
jgi:hypothetical protein